MDVVIKVVAFSLVVLFIYMLLHETKSVLSLMILLTAGILIFLFISPYIKEIISFMRSMADKVGMDFAYIQIVMKIIAIAYLSTFCSMLCRDAGVTVLGKKVEFTGKIMILFLAVPIMMSVLDSILKIM
ncbi:stage III sporulation protein AD [Clostridium tarantellae]|uniref:Stage III sporulation protein AD n=1 Tax=Clostridium tarantellae TaxID=39493 RepID=A0A6I1MJ81_9CLOT|nr:stage III sporulation protein AD [Clostridium tarantellae]MPQ42763.1 stage III sporulation protein AD [Clostridium tarantellae]